MRVNQSCLRPMGNEDKVEIYIFSFPSSYDDGGEPNGMENIDKLCHDFLVPCFKLIFDFKYIQALLHHGQGTAVSTKLVVKCVCSKRLFQKQKNNMNNNWRKCFHQFTDLTRSNMPANNTGPFFWQVTKYPTKLKGEGWCETNHDWNFSRPTLLFNFAIEPFNVSRGIVANGFLAAFIRCPRHIHYMNQCICRAKIV